MLTELSPELYDLRLALAGMADKTYGATETARATLYSALQELPKTQAQSRYTIFNQLRKLSEAVLDQNTSPMDRNALAIAALVICNTCAKPAEVATYVHGIEAPAQGAH